MKMNVEGEGVRDRRSTQGRPLLTDHAVDSAEEHRALGGCGALPQVLQHQRPVREHVDELPEVEDPHLLEVLPLLVRGGRAVGHHDNGRVIKDEESRWGMDVKAKTRRTEIKQPQRGRAQSRAARLWKKKS